MFFFFQPRAEFIVLLLVSRCALLDKCFKCPLNYLSQGLYKGIPACEIHNAYCGNVVGYYVCAIQSNQKGFL